MNKTIQFISLALVGITSFTQASAQTNENWNEVNLSVVDNQIIPHYAELALASTALASSAKTFCLNPNENTLSDFQVSFHQSLDSWEAIQHIQFGPITYFNWNYRLQYWPDEKGTGSRQMNALIASQDEASLALNSFARKSVGIQGFPALENLLFSETSLGVLTDNSYRCQVSQTIAENISEISTGVHSRWVDEYRAVVENADSSDEFENAEDVTIDLLKALVETVPKIQEQKIMSVLGDSFATSRVRRGESWRSERSLTNIKINLAALEELFNGTAEQNNSLSSVLLPADVVIINQAFSNIESNLQSLPESMHLALESETHYQTLETLLVQLETLDDVLEDSLKNTDLYLGFNSLDGD